MKKKLYLDLDDTLCHFVNAWLHWLYVNKYSNKLHKSSDVLDYGWVHQNYGESVSEFYIKDPYETYSTIKPMDKAKIFIEAYKDKFEIIICTHSTKLETALAKSEFCEKHFNYTNIKFFDSLYEKYLETSDGILIDDYPFHIIQHAAKNNQLGILFNYNGLNGWSCINDYKDLVLQVNPKLKNIEFANAFNDLGSILDKYAI